MSSLYGLKLLMAAADITLSRPTSVCLIEVVFPPTFDAFLMPTPFVTREAGTSDKAVAVIVLMFP
jgi:hypothetical protein